MTNTDYMARLKIDERELQSRRSFFEITDEDLQRLASLRPLAEKHTDAIVDAFYELLLSHAETRRFFPDDATVRRVKRTQREYFLGLFAGRLDLAYVEDRLRVGAAHERIGLAPKWYLGMYNHYLRLVANRLLEAFPNEPARAFSSFLTLTKLVFLDIGLAVDTYLYARESTMRKQQEAIRELSTPVLQIRDRLLLLPIIGIIDTHRARLITDGLLHSIRDTRAKVVVMDVTGVATIDTKVANHLIQTVTAARLMGAYVIVTGLSSDVAQALVGLGLDLAKLNTAGDLQGGIEEAERLLGYRIVRGAEVAPTSPE